MIITKELQIKVYLSVPSIPRKWLRLFTCTNKVEDTYFFASSKLRPKVVCRHLRCKDEKRPFRNGTACFNLTLRGKKLVVPRKIKSNWCRNSFYSINLAKS
jgi:hypothetical protein